MYTFLDESGIDSKTGHTIFVLVFVESADMPAVDNGFDEMLNQLKLSSTHWSDMAWAVRRKVFNEIKNLPFQFFVTVLNNPISNNMELVTQVLSQSLSTEDRPGAIYIDGKKSRKYIARLHKALREAGIKSRKLRTVTDAAYPGIQIADLIAGVYRHQLDKPSDNSARLQRMIANKRK